MLEYSYAEVQARCNMWTRLLGPKSSKRDRAAYAVLNGLSRPHEVLPIKEDYYPMSTGFSIPSIDALSGTVGYTAATTSFGNCQAQCCANTTSMIVYDDVILSTKNKKETTMGRYYDEHTGNHVDGIPSLSDLATAREYLADRLDQERDNKIYALRDTFHLDADEAPTTPEELVERIQSGKFILPTEEQRIEHAKYRNWDSAKAFRQIAWRDPATPADVKGFEAASKKVNSAQTDTLDVIKTSSEKEGLEALKAFTNTTFH